MDASELEETVDEAQPEQEGTAASEEETECVTGEVEDTKEEKTSEDAREEKTEETEPQGKGKKKKFFKKNKEAEKDKRDEKIEELTDKYLRVMAEFDNFRKRTEKEKAAMYDMGAKNVIEKLLPVIDNFDRGFETVKDADRETDSFINGMDLVYKQMKKTLEDMGVEPIETENKEFDPNLHNAVMHIDDDRYGENMIVQEFQKGYTYKGNVVRHSMVQVAN
jgi:molecular chaperone GrpE